MFMCSFLPFGLMAMASSGEKGSVYPKTWFKQPSFNRSSAYTSGAAVSLIMVCGICIMLLWIAKNRNSTNVAANSLVVAATGGVGARTGELPKELEDGVTSWVPKRNTSAPAQKGAPAPAPVMSPQTDSHA